MRILLVEDDEAAAQLLKETLKIQHYVVDCASDGEAGWQLAEAFTYNLILLDVMLPKLDGISFCRQRRHKGDRTPILLLTAQDSCTGKVAGLDAGADDYMVKPYRFDELLARIRALLRRADLMSMPVIEWEKLCLDPSNCKVTYNGQLLHLTPKEYSILELFLRNSHRIFSQSALLDHLWSFDPPPSENTVRAHVKSLRHKLKLAGAVDVIETVHGIGYRLNNTEDGNKGKGGASISREEYRHTSTQGRGEISTCSTGLQTSKLAAIWERHKDKYSSRISLLEQTVTAWETDTLSESLRQQALREAHTLVGSLGSFGFTQASSLCREIEQILQAGGTLSQPEIEHLYVMLATLRQELKKPPKIEQQQATTPTIVEPTVESKYRLLIVDDDAALAEQLILEATARGMLAWVASDLSEARLCLTHARPDAVLLDLSFPDSAEDGFALLAELTTKQPLVPVLVFTATESFADRVKVARLGGRGFLQKPVSSDRVIDAIVSVLQKSSQPSASLIIVDDDPQVLDFLRSLLDPWGFQLTLLNDPRLFWSTLEQSTPDLVILDLEMPELSGIDLCQVVRNDSRWRDLPVLFLSAHTDMETVQRVFASGADDYIRKPIIAPELIARVLSRVERTQILRKLTDIDDLTGLTNRRRSVQQLTQLLRLAERQGQPLCFIVLDLDHFKQVNDQYGHHAGDKVLRRLGELLNQNFRHEDVAARWGGEEFVIGLYNTTKSSGVKRLTKFLEILRQQEFTDTKNRKFHVSFSAGVAEFPKDGTDLQALYRAADVLLYQAKAAGRNLVLAN